MKKGKEPSEHSKNDADTNSKYKRVIYTEDSQLIDDYIGSVIGIGEEEV